ncbi:MAG: alpha/beta hydrolase [Firmicutes bacterium]|nr:alpha/beta hydrolase [Alicyclobacillaceae bacterium]MCL6497577.1 alpha/beta hydrolase [Bacillota bacterium]
MRAGTGIRYHQLGEGPLAVLVHPDLYGGRFAWHRLIPAWSRRYTVVSWDPRGVGDHRRWVPSMRDWVADAEAVLEAVDRPAHLVGLGVGAWVMARVAITDDPRVRSLVLAGVTARGAGALGIGKGAGGPPAVAEALVSSAVWPEVRDNLEQELAEQDAAVLYAAVRAAAAASHRPVFQRIRRPTLVVVGTHDRLAPPRDAERVARLVPRSRLAVLLGAGHLAPLDQPGRFDEAVRDFWVSLEGPGGRRPPG